MQILKQSTATTVYVGPVLDASGAAVTTAVLGDFRLVKNGTAATLTGATVTHDANGYYTIALTTTNTDTTGRLTLAVGNTAQSMATHRFTVLLASVFDAIVANATNTTGGLATATAAITALSGAVSTLTAANVRTELATELGRIDETISSRMATYTQPTGFLSATFPAILASPTNITAATGIVLSPVTHTGARIPNVTLVDTTTVNTDMRGTNNALLASDYTTPLNTTGTAAAVWNALLTTYTTSGSFGARVMRLDSASSGNEAKVTGAGHVAADLHELQPAVITAAAFAANWLTAAGTAADYITKLQTAIGTAANQGVILDRTAYALTVLAGACSDAQTTAETYVLTLNGNTFTVDYSGLDASGNRGATTLSKV